MRARTHTGNQRHVASVAEFLRNTRDGNRYSISDLTFSLNISVKPVKTFITVSALRVGPECTQFSVMSKRKVEDFSYWGNTNIKNENTVEYNRVKWHLFLYIKIMLHIFSSYLVPMEKIKKFRKKINVFKENSRT